MNTGVYELVHPRYYPIYARQINTNMPTEGFYDTPSILEVWSDSIGVLYDTIIPYTIPTRVYADEL